MSKHRDEAMEGIVKRVLAVEPKLHPNLVKVEAK